MKYNPEIHHRRSIRLKEYDYSQMGAYFITICTHNRQCLFGMITNNELHLNEQGKMIYNYWQKLTTGFSHIQLDEFVVMPNHLHGIVFIGEENDNICRGESCIRPQIINENIMGEHKVRPYGTVNKSLGRIIQAFKSITTLNYIKCIKKHRWEPFNNKLWQRNYYEHIIRNDDELNKIREYIISNPIIWEKDEDNPNKIIIVNRDAN